MRKKFMMLPVVLFFFIVISANNIFAADCAIATIKRVGVVPAVVSSLGSSPYMVQLDCSNDAVWPGTLLLLLSKELGESGFATLLTAYSLGKTVWVQTLGVKTGSIVTIIYMND